MSQTQTTLEQKVVATDIKPKPESRSLLHDLIAFFSSLKLSVVFLCLAVVLVFVGTVAQTSEGLYTAQNRYFRSLVIWWSPAGAQWRIPIFPGGYLVGGVLLINLLAAHAKRFKFTKKKIGLLVIHAGLVLLMLGQFATDMLSKESAMQLQEGETKNYSEAFREYELALIDTSDPDRDRVYSIPESRLKQGAEIRDPQLPFTIRVKNHWANADVSREQKEGFVEGGATAGMLAGFFVSPQARSGDPDSRNFPAATVELLSPSGSAGTFLTFGGMMNSQRFMANGKSYEMGLRATRFYYPFQITLLKATHEKYKGTDIPKNFASRVRVENPTRNENRETVIYMNNPLRYSGLTFFQYQMSADEMAMRQGQRASSTLQVVRNPSWLTPYLSCVLVGLGLVIQFSMHLYGFAKKRRSA